MARLNPYSQGPDERAKRMFEVASGCDQRGNKQQYAKSEIVTLEFGALQSGKSSGGDCADGCQAMSFRAWYHRADAGDDDLQ
jgi:hypothetical protein